MAPFHSLPRVPWEIGDDRRVAGKQGWVHAQHSFLAGRPRFPSRWKEAAAGVKRRHVAEMCSAGGEEGDAAQGRAGGGEGGREGGTGRGGWDV